MQKPAIYILFQGMKGVVLYTFLITFFFLNKVNGQQQAAVQKTVSYTDTVFMMNGDILPAFITDTSFHGVKLLKPDKKRGSKEIIIEGDLIFSLKFSSGYEKIIYRYDSAGGNEFTTDEARLFILGQRDAEKGYRSPFITAGGFIIGATAGSVGSLLAPFPPFAYSGIMLIPKIRVKHKSVSDPNYLKNDAYLLGYEKVARRRRAARSFLGGISGLAVGLIINSIVK